MLVSFTNLDQFKVSSSLVKEFLFVVVVTSCLLSRSVFVLRAVLMGLPASCAIIGSAGTMCEQTTIILFFLSMWNILTPIWQPTICKHLI